MTKRRLGAGVIGLAIKLGPKILTTIGKLGKALKVGKAGMAAGTMAAYSYLFTWEFALAIMFAIFVHESGHVWAMKRCGMRVKGIYFLPFLGGAAVTEDSFKSRWEESFIALAGPVWGLGLAFVCAGAYWYTELPILAALAAWMAMVNLFNLLPINPLDGGRVMKSIAFSVHGKLGLWCLGIGVLIAAGAAIAIQSFLFALLAVIGFVEAMSERKDLKRNLERNDGTESFALAQFRNAKPHMSRLEIGTTVAAYLAIAGMLFWLMDAMQHVPGADIARQILIDSAE